tara:strand:+ start:638 stop:1258 length:621 start_codon:yes stop_codon:yes gene_type:complete
VKTDITILQQPNVPKMLHKLAPRVIESSYWWKKQRDTMLVEQDMCCKACGIQVDHRSKLDLHEEYHINYQEGYSDVKGMVGLCKDCHSFIHNGLLFIRAKNGEISFDRANYIFRRGFTLLKEAGLEPNHSAAVHYVELLNHFGKNPSKGLINRAFELTQAQSPVSINKNWNEWHLRWKGKKYYSLFTDIEDWKENVATRKYERTTI